MKKLLFVILTLFLTNLKAQNISNQINILEQQYTDTTDAHLHSLGMNSTSHLKDGKKSILFPLFWIYKNFISSQDSQQCGFHPSCSVYALQAVRKKGIILGVIDGFDRLLRCNGSQDHEQYEFSTEKNLYLDEVK